MPATAGDRAVAIVAWTILAFLLLPSLVIVPIAFGNSNEIIFPPKAFGFELFRRFFTEPGWVAAALVSLAWLGGGRPNIGQNLELTSLTAAMLGGIGIFGGRGGVFGVLAAVLLLVTLQTGLLQLNVNTVWQVGVVGTILVIVLLIDNLALIRRTA